VSCLACGSSWGSPSECFARPPRLFLEIPRGQSRVRYLVTNSPAENDPSVSSFSLYVLATHRRHPPFFCYTSPSRQGSFNNWSPPFHPKGALCYSVLHLSIGSFELL